MKKALLLVDIQNDFLPGGSLAVPGGDIILDYVINLIDSDAYQLLIATLDYHPADHGSFASNHSGRQPFETGSLDGIEQVLWPDHCISGTQGAEIESSVRASLNQAVERGRKLVEIHKGEDRSVDSYSGFFDNKRRRDTGLHQILKDNEIIAVDIVGLALDYCVQATATDAASLGYTTAILLPGTRAIDTASLSGLFTRLEQQGISMLFAENSDKI